MNSIKQRQNATMIAGISPETPLICDADTGCAIMWNQCERRSKNVYTVQIRWSDHGSPNSYGICPGGSRRFAYRGPGTTVHSSLWPFVACSPPNSLIVGSNKTMWTPTWERARATSRVRCSDKGGCSCARENSRK